MASEDILAALLGGGSTDPLASFQKATASNNMLKMAAAPVLGAKFNNSTWTPLETFGTSAAQAFLGTFLQGLGQRREDEQLMKVASIYPELLKDPLSVAVPEGVDSNAFNALKLGQLQKNTALEAAREQKKQDMNDAIDLAIATKDPYTYAAMQRARAAQGVGPKSVISDLFGGADLKELAMQDPESRDYKLEKDKKEAESKLFNREKEINDELLTGNSAKIALQANSQLETLFKAFQHNNPQAAATGVASFIKLGDPGATIMGNDVVRVSDPGGLYGQLQQLAASMKQEGITPQIKEAIKQIAPEMVKAQFNAYNQVRDGYLDMARKQGLDPDRISYIKPLDYAALLDEKTTSDPLTGESLTNKSPSWMPKSQTAQAELAVKLKEIEKEANKYPVGSAEREQIFNLAKQLVEGRKPQVAGSPIG